VSRGDIYLLNDSSFSNRLLVGVLIDKKVLHSSRLHKKRAKANLNRELLFAAEKNNIDLFYFQSKDVDWNQKQVRGYTYSRGRWITKTYPIPKIVYNRIIYRSLEAKEINQDFLNRYAQLPDCVLFNSRFLDKWEVHEALSQNSSISAFLPETYLFSQEKLAEMLSKYDEVFIKPRNSSLGKGIIKVVKHSHEYWYCSAVTLTSRPIWRKTRDLSSLFKRLKLRINKEQEMLIQQGIKLLQYQERVFDLRTLVQKDGRGNWGLTGVGVRIAAPHKFVTHIPNGGRLANIYKHLNRVLDYDSSRVNNIYRQLEHLSNTVPAELENKMGLKLGVLTFDVGIDENDKVWLIEINSKPARFDEKDIRSRFLQKLMDYFWFLDKNTAS